MRVDQFRELCKDFYHLIGTFTTSRDNYDVSFRLFGDGMLKHRLTRTKRSRNKSCTTFYNRVHCINHTYTRFQQFVRTRFLLIISHGFLHRPFLNHIYRDVITLCICKYSYGIFNGILSFLYYGLYFISSLQLERYHDFQRLMVFFHFSQPGRRSHFITRFHNRLEQPFLFLVQRISILTTFQKYSLHFIEIILQPVIILRKHARS